MVSSGAGDLPCSMVSMGSLVGILSSVRFRWVFPCGHDLMLDCTSDLTMPDYLKAEHVFGALTQLLRDTRVSTETCNHLNDNLFPCMCHGCTHACTTQRSVTHPTMRCVRSSPDADEWFVTCLHSSLCAEPPFTVRMSNMNIRPILQRNLRTACSTAQQLA